MKKQLCTLVVRREKIKKKHKQSIIGDNLTKQTTNNKRKIMHFSCQERKERKKCKQSIIDGNPTMICIHTPHCVEEGTVAYPVRWRMTRFDHREGLAIRSRTHCMGFVLDSKLSLFFFSILFITLLFFLVFFMMFLPIINRLFSLYIGFFI